MAKFYVESSYGCGGWFEGATESDVMEAFVARHMKDVDDVERIGARGLPDHCATREEWADILRRDVGIGTFLRTEAEMEELAEYQSERG